MGDVQPSRSRIKKIGEDSVRLVQSGLVITSLSAAVKELLENSLDSGAKNIEIKLTNFGLDQIQVVDDGSGIHPDDFISLGLKHHTSKLSGDIDTLDTVTSFGFRGEALNALCTVSKVTILTRHTTQNLAFQLEFSHDGSLLSDPPPARKARVEGTTVTIKDFFCTMPVRRKDFESRFKREYERMINLITGYAVGCIGIRLSVTNLYNGQLKTGLRVSGKSVKDNIVELFGSKQYDELIPFNQSPYSDDNEDGSAISITGFISKCDTGCGRSSSDREYYHLNKRPCDLPGLVKVIHEIYKIYNRNKFPFVFMNITTNPRKVDVNVAPDKRKILLGDDYLLNAIVRVSLLAIYQKNIGQMPSEQAQFPQVTTTPLTFSKPMIRSFKDFLAGSKPVSVTQSIQSFSPFKRSAEPEGASAGHSHKRLAAFARASSPCDSIFEEGPSGVPSSLSDISQLPQEPSLTNIKPRSSLGEKLSKYMSGAPPIKNVNSIRNSSCASDSAAQSAPIQDEPSEPPTSSTPSTSANSTDAGLSTLLGDVLKNSSNSQILNLQDSNSHAESSPSKETCSNEIEPVSTPDTSETNSNVPISPNYCVAVHIYITMDDIRKKAEKHQINMLSRFLNDVCNDVTQKVNFQAQNANYGTAAQTEADAEIQRAISCSDFKTMTIVGQFNKSFILAYVNDTSSTSTPILPSPLDVYIIDQHASDERNNYERLLRETRLVGQPLLSPISLDLDPTSHSILLDNIMLFKKWGFDFETENAGKILLTRAPHSKENIFDNRDINELIGVILENSPNFAKTYLLSKFKRMIAYRACRSAIMIGTALSRTQASNLLKNMANLEQPWICAHGRPSIRHLITFY